MTEDYRKIRSTKNAPSTAAINPSLGTETASTGVTRDLQKIQVMHILSKALHTLSRPPLHSLNWMHTETFSSSAMQTVVSDSLK